MLKQFYIKNMPKRGGRKGKETNNSEQKKKKENGANKQISK